MLGAVILGAGFARRFGSDKRTHAFGDSTVARSTLKLYLQVFEHIRVVVRTDDEILSAHISDLPIETVATDQASKGMGLSLRAGFTNLSWRYAFVGLLDMPFVQATTLEALTHKAAQSDYQRIIRPCYTGPTVDSEQPPWGHPIGFPHAMFSEFDTLEGDAGARQVLLRHAGEIEEFATQDQGVVRDIDKPSDLPVA